MRAASEVWRHTTGDVAADEVWGRALLSLREAEAAQLAADYGNLEGGEKKVVRLLAHHQPLYGAAAERLGLTAGSAQHARDALLADGELREFGEELVVTDPLLADWVRQRLPV
jgi:hypothetical protein